MAKALIKLEHELNFTPKEIAKMVWEMDVKEQVEFMEALATVSQKHLVVAQAQYLENFEYSTDVKLLFTTLSHSVHA